MRLKETGGSEYKASDGVRQVRFVPGELDNHEQNSEETDSSKWGSRWKQLLSDLDRFIIPVFLLMAVIALGIFQPTILVFTVVTLVLLAPSVLIHEWGHYIVARRNGLGVEEFSIGFGKRLWSRRSKKTGVLWSFKAIPLGGSVEVAGMTVNDVEKNEVPRERAYIHAKPWTRFKVVTAGVFLNVVLAWVVLSFASLGVSGEWSLRGVLLAPLAAGLTLIMLTREASMALGSAVVSWDADVSSILRMPEHLETGLATATDGGMNPFLYYALILSLINLSLAIFNALPLFPLDGYHALVAVLDKIRNVRAKRKGRERPSPLRKEQLTAYTRVTGAALGVFVISIFSRDIIRMLTSG